MRNDHKFQFRANAIAEAAEDEAKYHRSREKFWRGRYDEAVAVVTRTAGVKIEKRPQTGGYSVDVVVDYGDPAAYRDMQRSYSKIDGHVKAAEAFESDASVYSSQGDRSYDLTRDDVRYYRLGGEPRDDDEK